ncbi:hypothetical protein ABK040_008425 [Willaertia magna]
MSQYLANLTEVEADFMKQQVVDYDKINYEYNNLEDEGYLAEYAKKYKNNELLIDDVELEDAELAAYNNILEAQKKIQYLENKERGLTESSSSILFSRSREPIFDADAIKGCLNKLPILTKNLDWIYHLRLDSLRPLTVNDPEDDVDRELQFYNQALSSAKEGFLQLHELNIPVHRPDDYFAEMVKSDEHMERIKNKIIKVRETIQEREKNRERKKQQKIGKQLKAEKLKEKIARKKEGIKAVEHWRKTQGGKGKEFNIEQAEKDYKQFASDDKKRKTGGNKEKKRPGKNKRQKQNRF